MGRIKTKLTKRISNQLVSEHSDRFKKDFTENKPKVAELAQIRSKKLLNTKTGYVTRLMKSKD